MLLRNLPTLAILLLFSMFLTDLLNAQGRRQRYPVAVGAEHPDFRLPNVKDGQPVSLNDFRGEKVLLVHFASW